MTGSDWVEQWVSGGVEGHEPNEDGYHATVRSQGDSASLVHIRLSLCDQPEPPGACLFLFRFRPHIGGDGCDAPGWDGLEVYAFPSLAVIHQVLLKLR